MIVALNLDEKKLNEFNNDRVSVFKSVPQLEILSRADLFITHGGFNSIKESIFYTVPMLVFPIEFKTDHPGNSARVIYHRFGLRGDARKDSPSGIKEKIETLLSDGSFKKNMQIFQKEKEKDDEELLSIVQSIPEFQKVVTPLPARDDQPT
jgi:UDP:flavonoid glycosyltransferase YjiC (YdhE family)